MTILEMSIRSDDFLLVEYVHFFPSVQILWLELDCEIAERAGPSKLVEEKLLIMQSKVGQMANLTTIRLVPPSCSIALRRWKKIEEKLETSVMRLKAKSTTRKSPRWSPEHVDDWVRRRPALPLPL